MVTRRGNKLNTTLFDRYYSNLDDGNNTEMGKANKSVKMRTQILFKLSGSMFFKWKK